MVVRKGGRPKQVQAGFGYSTQSLRDRIIKFVELEWEVKKVWDGPEKAIKMMLMQGFLLDLERKPGSIDWDLRRLR